MRECVCARVCALQSDELFTTEASTEDLQKLRKELEESRYCEGCFVLGRLCQGQRDSSVGSRVLASGVCYAKAHLHCPKTRPWRARVHAVLTRTACAQMQQLGLV
jgi:hypothetical protein